MARYNPIRDKNTVAATHLNVSVEDINLEFNKLNQLQHLRNSLKLNNASNEHYQLIHQSLVKNHLIDKLTITSLENASFESDQRISLEAGILDGIKKVVGKIIDMLKALFVGYINLTETFSFKTSKARMKEAYEWFQTSREYRNQKFTISVRPSFPVKFEPKSYENYSKLIGMVTRLFTRIDIQAACKKDPSNHLVVKQILNEWRTKQAPSIVKMNAKGLPQGVEVDTNAPSSFFIVNSKGNEKVGEKLTVVGDVLVSLIKQADVGFDVLEEGSEKQKEIGSRKDDLIKVLTKVMNGQEGSDVAIQAGRVWSTTFAQYVKLLSISKTVYTDLDQVVTRATKETKDSKKPEGKDTNKPDGAFGGHIAAPKGLFD